MRVLIGVLGGLVLTPANAGAEPSGDPSRGHDIVDLDQRGPVPDGIPSFMALAARPGETENDLLGSLISPPHPQMPNPPLDRQQMRDTVAYILSLRAP